MDLPLAHRVPPQALELEYAREHATAQLLDEPLVRDDSAEHRVLAQPVEAQECLREAPARDAVGSGAVVVECLGEYALLRLRSEVKLSLRDTPVHVRVDGLDHIPAGHTEERVRRRHFDWPRDRP